MRSPRVFPVTSKPAAVPFACSAIVTDIEGTTGSIAFVRDVLFPYAQEHLAAFVARSRSDSSVAQALREAALVAGEPEASDERVIAILRAWMAEDRKITPLKTLQGLIWAEGYARGVLQGHVYEDAAAALRRWHAAGFTLFVYSSGSVAAQQLLFGHSSHGDLTPLLSGYFDTTIGPKTDAASYERIAAAIGEPPERLLFLSDREGELEACAAAGWQVARLARPADGPGDAVGQHPVFTTFDTIDVRR